MRYWRRTSHTGASQPTSDKERYARTLRSCASSSPWISMVASASFAMHTIHTAANATQHPLKVALRATLLPCRRDYPEPAEDTQAARFPRQDAELSGCLPNAPVGA